MIAIFLNKTDAQNYSDKVHGWLRANCSGYNAVRWQEPVKHPKENKWFIQIPQEYEKPLYKNSSKIVASCKTELFKAVEQIEKPTIDWRPEEKELSEVKK